MSIAQSLQRYLEDHAVNYSTLQSDAQDKFILAHDDTITVAQTKVFGCPRGYVMAVYPADWSLDFLALDLLLGRRLTSVSDSELHRIFPDADITALPPLGEAYGIVTVVDNLLMYADEITFAGGKPNTYVSVDMDDFRKMMAKSIFGNISYPPHQKN